MAQTVPLSKVAVTSAEHAHDLFKAIFADGPPTPDEIARMQMALDIAYRDAQRADLARAAGVALLRGGFTGRRARELYDEWVEGEEAIGT